MFCCKQKLDLLENIQNAILLWLFCKNKFKFHKMSTELRLIHTTARFLHLID